VTVPGVDDSTVVRLIKADRVRVLFDGLGVRKERAEHLVWLNAYLPLKTMSMERLPVQESGGRDLGRWLESLATSAPSTGSSA
jgi:hypothetical protein